MPSCFVWKAVLIGCVGPVLVALHIGSINGMFEMHGFQSTFPELFEHTDNCSKDSATDTLHFMLENVTVACGRCSVATTCGGSGAGASSILGLMVSIGSIGAVVGAFFGGWLSTTKGRRLTLSISGWVMAVGSGLAATSFHSGQFILGRGISGASMGVLYGPLLIYISEMSPMKSRGMMASLTGLAYGSTLLVIFAANCGFSYFCLGWRISFVIQVVLGALYAVAMLLMPRTPRWLLLHNHIDEAHLVLSRINGFSTVDSSAETCTQLEELKSTTSELSSNYFKNLATQFSTTLKWNYFRRLLLCSTLLMLAPIVGNFTYYFGSTFFCKLSINSCSANTIVGFSLLFGGLLTPILMDKAGRKVILLLGTSLMLFLQVVMTTLILVFKLEEDGNDVVGYILTGLFCTFALAYSATWITTPWLISGEVFPVEIRGINVAISTGIFWISAAVVTQVTPIIIDSALGIAGLLSLLIGFTIVSIFVVLVGLPETNGVSLEKMDDLFDQHWLERVNLAYYISCGISSVFKNSKSRVQEETSRIVGYISEEHEPSALLY